MSNHLIEKRTQIVKRIASEMGFSFCGISKAEFLEEEAPRLEDWLNKGLHAGMSYMENHFDKRLDPTKLVEDCKSVISVMVNYYPEKEITNSNYKISKYAYGKDYHIVIREKLNEFLNKIQLEIGESVDGRGFTDSAPILERAWAKKSGLGWVGKNANLISKKHGSFYFLANLLVNLELNTDGPTTDHCGSCTACIDACPTDAIQGNRIINSNSCISYLTIELKDASIPEEFKGKFDDWMFGCDVCQDVCPWNKFSSPHKEEAFRPKENLPNMSNKDWEDMTQEVFSELFSKSAIKRTKLKGLQRNISFLKSNTR